MRYVTTDVNDNNEPDNIRIGFMEAANQTAKSLESDELNFLNTLDVNLAKCRGQGYDGAANMSGAYWGLQKLIKDKQPRANYVHCSTYNLNLVLNDACNNVPHLSGYGHELVARVSWVRVLLSLKTRRVDEAIPPADVVVRKEGCQLRCPPRYSTEVQNYEACDQ
ncbi:hypothetical protein TNCV_4274491 [Trichonephila clavipes]|nr:hypothetical protein TNCV_4274491 [Trichonephila clavipes]